MKLFTTSNAKTPKGEELGYLTLILYLLPSDEYGEGVELCKFKSPLCYENCLGHGGRLRMSKSKRAARERTRLYLEEPALFWKKIEEEVAYYKRRAMKKGWKLAVRMNGDSDVSFWREPKYNRIRRKHSDVMFYEYTKDPMTLKVAKDMDNFHVTFSRSEINEKHCVKALADGFNVAVVYKGKRKPWYDGLHVVDGDAHDLRFLDEPNAIVALKAKGKARHGADGFVLDWSE